MKDFVCPNCGNIVVESEPECKYCGTKNPNFNGESTAVAIKENDSNGSQQASSGDKKNFSVALFVILLIFFWPAALIYAIIASTKK